MERAREEAQQAGVPLTWAILAARCGLSTPGTMRKMLQGDAPIDDATAARIAAAVECELLVVRAGRS